GARDQVAQDLTRDLDALGRLSLGKSREVFFGQPGHLEADALAFDGGPGVGQDLEAHVAVRKRTGDLVELLRPEGDRAVRDDLSRAPTPKRDVEVRGRDAQLTVP